MLRRKSGRGDSVAELDELQRKYRLMEVNRKSYSEDSQNTIRMQRQQIEKLKKDNDRLKEDLALETRQAKQANNMSASAQIAKLQDQGDIFTRKIEIEKRRIEELDKQIKKMQSTILMQRKEMGGVNATRESNQAVQKQIRILENRLDKALVKFNEALAHNKQLRETIDNLRRERVVFDGIYRKLERELHEKKNKMASIIEISNAAYEARDLAQSEMVALKAQADKEQANFELEWSQLAQAIEKDRKMKDFIKTKEREKIGGTITATTGGGNASASTSGTGTSSGSGATGVIVSTSLRGGDPALEEEAKLRKRVTKGAWGIAKDKANIHLSMEKVQAYEEAFAKIQKATKITDIDELVSTFVNAEDANFSLFNYVNDLSNEIEKLEDSINEIKTEINKYKGNGANNDNARKKILQELDAKLSKTEEKANYYEERYQTALETVSSLKQGIQNIFNKIGCNNAAVTEMLGSAGVTESNMMQYLGIIEQRTNELLQLYAMQRDTDQEYTSTGNSSNSSNSDVDGRTHSSSSKHSNSSADHDLDVTGLFNKEDANATISINAPSTLNINLSDEESEGEEDVMEEATKRAEQRAFAVS